MKTCKKCHIIKDFYDFHKSKKHKDGFRSDCKLCRKVESKRYYSDKSDVIKERINNYRIGNVDIINEIKLKYRENNKEKISTNNKKYREGNKDKISEYQKIYRCVNKEKLNLYRKNRLNNDKLFKIKHNIGNLIRISIKNGGFTKKSRTHEILGCSFEEFKQHIESQWESWMNWDNHGLYNGEENYGWDMDHITPIVSALNENEVIKLNNSTNFQPLCSYINRNIKRGMLKNQAS